MPKRNEAKEWAKESVRGVFFGNTTPFTEDLSAIDEDALQRNLEHCVALGADGIGWGGPLAEPSALTLAERKRGHEILAEVAQKAGIVSYAYPTSDSIPDTVDLSRHAADVGCDVLMLNVPFEWMKTDSMIYEFYELVSEKAGDIGIMLYNTPHSGYILPLELMDRIANIPNVCCHKGSGGSFEENVAQLKLLGDRVVISAGGPADWPRYAAAGFQQMPPTSAAYMLQTKDWQPIQAVYDLSAAARYDQAWEICRKLEPLYATWRKVYATLFGREFGREEHPAGGIKAWQDLIGMAGGPVRPLTSPFSAEDREWLVRDLSAHVASGLLKLPKLNVPEPALAG